jgi:hypothetical protein
MADSLTNQSRKVLALASEAARSFNHAYVGTEHILLGLVEEHSAAVSEVIETFGIDADKIRAEIDKLVTRGPGPVALKTLPLTPRATHIIDHAHTETQLMGESCVSPEHLFLGLMNDPAGVACQVLLNLGINRHDLTKEVFKVRLGQMKVVERIVRPVRASTQRKRKMREELAAHLSAIYDQELATLQNPTAALEAAARRLGEPAELARELEDALPYHERISSFIERWFAWRAPESLAHFAVRQGVLTFNILAIVFPALAAAVVLRYGWIPDTKTFVRLLTSILAITPPAQTAICWTTLKMRNALWGVFGSHKSMFSVFLYGTLTAGIVMASFFGFAWAIDGNLGKILASPTFCSFAGVVAAIGSYLVARFTGATTIRDTLWAMLDTETA